MPADARSAPFLAFDTSAAHCAAALILPDGGSLLRHEDMQRGQAERLFPLIKEMMDEAGLDWTDLGGLAVGTGPGNFTGIRIAVSAARGLALGLDVAAIGVTLFEALAHGLPRPLRVMQDARRGLIYLQDFLADEALPARLVRMDEVGVFAGAVTGTAALVAGQVSLAPAMPLVAAIAEIGIGRLRSGAGLPRPAPFYLRAADALPPADPPPLILDA